MCIFFYNQKTADERRISDWSSDVCSSDLIDDAGPRLNAVIELNPDALEEADARDAEREAGKVRGPLHGIPMLLKDNIDATPMVNSAGSLALADHRPQDDAFIVRRLREAGAVITGTTNLTAWANLHSDRTHSGWSAPRGQTHTPSPPAA